MESMLLAAGAVTVLVLVLVVRQVVRGCARTVFAAPPEPTADELRAARTPRPLPEPVPCPQAQLLTEQASAALIAWMQAVNSRDESRLTARGLCGQLADTIAAQTKRGERERFERPMVHGAVVSAWTEEQAAVTLAAQAVHYTACGGALVRGREDLPEQMLWELRGTMQPDGRWEITQVKEHNGGN